MISFSTPVYFGYVGVDPSFIDVALVGSVHSPDRVITPIIRGMTGKGAVCIPDCLVASGFCASAADCKPTGYDDECQFG